MNSCHLHKKIFFLILLWLVLSINILPVYALSARVSIPEKYSSVTAGERLYFEIEIKYPENNTRKDLRLDYEILDEREESLTRTKALKAVETQASFIDYLVIPESAKHGTYTLKVGVGDYAHLDEEITTTFNIESQKTQIDFYFLAILGAVGFVGLVTIFDIILRLKKK